VAARSRAPRLAFALAILATTCGVATSHAATACATPGRLTRGRDGWTRIAPPSFPTGDGSLTGYAVDPYRPEHLYVTDGISIGVSADGGCAWKLPALPPEQADAIPAVGAEGGGILGKRHIIDVAVPVSRFDAGSVWALAATEVVTTGTPLVEPRVFYSGDHGASFNVGTGGLPTFARPLALWPVGIPGTAYLLVDNTTPQSVRELYLTNDGGGTWRRAATNLPAFVKLAGGEYDPRLLFAWDDKALYRSADSGASWSPVSGVSGSPQHVDVATTQEGMVVTAFTTTREVRFVSGDGGRTFTGRPGPDTVTSVTHGPLPGMMALSSVVDGVTVEPPRVAQRAPYDASPDATVSRLQLTQTLVDGRWVLYAFSPTEVLSQTFAPDFAPPHAPHMPPPPRKYVPLRPPAAPPVKVPTLRPANPTITLRPGEHRKVPFSLLLPPNPTPLDVMFLTDSTRSMGSTISSVQENVQQIADDLAASGVDVQFGVADFRDYRSEAPQEDNYPYLRRRAVGPINAELATALQGITTGGGTGDGDDSALEAVYQAATGAGRPIVPGTGVPGAYLISPGQGANFRPDAEKIILLASDDEMRHPDPTGDPGYPGPELGTVVAALRSTGVHLVGIRVRTSEGGDPSADMKRLALGSGTVAPPGGVDCDGDVDTEDDDLGNGEPLVCEFTPGGDSTIAPAFLALLRGIRDLAAVDVAVTGPASVVRPLVPTRFDGVNLKAYNDLTVPVEVRCDKADYGTDQQFAIGARSRGIDLVRTTATVRCLTPEPPDVFSAPTVFPPVAIAAAVAPAPPAPVSNAQPNPNPNPNPNPQLNPNTGMAGQEDQQFQVATAENELPPDEDLAFSAVHSPLPPTPALAWALAVSMAAAAAFGLRRSFRTAPAYAAAKEHRP
jgi:hypothetical protein